MTTLRTHKCVHQLRRVASVGVLALLSACGSSAVSPPASSSAATSAPATVSGAPQSSPPSSAVASPSAKPAASGGRLDTVTYTGSSNFTTFGPLYLALQNGYFREQGIDLKLNQVNSDADTLTGLVSDSTDVGGSSFTAGIINAIARGADIRAVAASTVIEPGHGNGAVVIRPGLNATVKTVKDVKGLKFGICSLNSSCELLAETFLAKGGLTSKDVTYQVLGFPNVAPALTSKGVDIAIIIEPLYTAGLSKGLFDTFVENGDIWPPDTTASAVFFSNKFRTERKEVAQRYTVALLQGMRSWLDAFVYKGPNRKAAVDMMVQNTPIKDPALYDKLDVPSMDPKGYGKTPETIDANLAFLTRKGQVTKPLKAMDIWDPSFLDYANSKLPPYKPAAS